MHLVRGTARWYRQGMGNAQTTRTKIAKRQSVKLREALSLLASACEREITGKGSHRVYFIGTDRLVLSQPKGDTLMPYQLKQIDDWLNRNGK